MNALLTHALQQQQQQVQKQLQQTTAQLQQQQQLQQTTAQLQQQEREQEIAQQLLQHGASESIAVQVGTDEVSTSAVDSGSSVEDSHSARTTANMAVRGATGHVTVLGGGLCDRTPAITSPAVKPGGGRLATHGNGGGGVARGVTIQGIGRGSGLQGVRLGGGASVSVGLGGGTIPAASSIGGSRGSLVNNLASKLSKSNTVSPGEKGISLGRSQAVGGTVIPTLPRVAVPPAVGRTVPAKAPGASMTGSRASAIAAEARGLGTTSEQGGVDSGNSRTPVFAQILANMRKQQKLISKAAIDGGLSVSSPAPLLSKQRDNFVHASIPTRNNIANTDPKMSSRTAAKHNSQLAHTLIDHEEAELLDVGRPFQIMELPPHLKEHDYSLYNPEEGEKVTRDKNMRIASNIPPSRVSYAPQVSPEVIQVQSHWHRGEIQTAITKDCQ